MLKKDVKIGGIYAAKVSNLMAPVKLLSEAYRYDGRRCGWNARNLITNRQIRIKSAAKLRFELERVLGTKKFRKVAS